MPDDLQREARTYWRQIDLDKTAEYRLLQRLTALLTAHGTTVTRVDSNSSKVYLEILRRIAQGDPPEKVAEAHPRLQFRSRVKDAINPDLPHYVCQAVGDALDNFAYLRRRSSRYEDLLQELMEPFSDQVRRMRAASAATPRLRLRYGRAGETFHRLVCRFKSHLVINDRGELVKNYICHLSLRRN